MDRRDLCEPAPRVVGEEVQGMAGREKWQRATSPDMRVTSAVRAALEEEGGCIRRSSGTARDEVQQLELSACPSFALELSKGRIKAKRQVSAVKFGRLAQLVRAQPSHG